MADIYVCETCGDCDGEHDNPACAAYEHPALTAIKRAQAAVRAAAGHIDTTNQSLDEKTRTEHGGERLLSDAADGLAVAAECLTAVRLHAEGAHAEAKQKAAQDSPTQ